MLSSLLLVACAAPVQSVDGLTFGVPTDYGFCGALAVSPGEAVTPGHCARRPLRCDTMRDLCWIEDRPRERLAALRDPIKGEPARITLPSGDSGKAIVLAVSYRWRAAWLDWPCMRGDSGGVAWGSDGSALCMMTGCDVTTGTTYCEELTP